MTVPQPEERVGEAHARYLHEAGFDPPDAPTVSIPLGPLTLPFPNTAARKRVVWLHDLQHLATGYGTDWPGEVEEAAFELAAGCGHHPAAWALNFGVFAVGQAIAPRRAWHAYVRGRHAQSLYRLEGEFTPALLDERVGELRARMGLDGPAEATAADRLSYAAALGVVAASAAVLPLTFAAWCAAQCVAPPLPY